MAYDILSFCTPFLKSRPFRRIVMNPYFPLTFWLLNILELENRGIFENKPPIWIKSFLFDHLRTRSSCFSTIYRKLHPTLIAKVTSNFSIDETRRGYCNHCGQCCFFFGGLGKFPEPWPFLARWKRFFTDGLGRYHLFCAFLWEWRRTGKSLCSIYPWRPVVCDLFGEDECRYYLEAPNLPHDHIPRAFEYMQTVFRHLT